MQTSLRGIANKATTDKTHRFRNLFGLLTVGFLEWCWQFVNLRAAPGIDRVTAESHGANLLANIRELAEKVKAGRYRAKWVLRRYIPKLNGKWRPQASQPSRISSYRRPWRRSRKPIFSPAATATAPALGHWTPWGN